MDWLVLSIVLSVVLTVLLNVALRVFPGLGHRIARAFGRLESRAAGSDRRHERRVRVFFPWKTMIVASVILTIVLNLARWIR